MFWGGNMKDYIEERTIEVANYIIENKCTVRACAKYFNISKSTIQKDVSGLVPRAITDAVCGRFLYGSPNKKRFLYKSFFIAQNRTVKGFS